MGQLTPNDVKRWDLGAIQKVFETANGRANTLQALGENLQQVHNVLSGWQGKPERRFVLTSVRLGVTSRPTVRSPGR